MTGYTFRASNGEWYAISSEGEQSPSFHTEVQAARHLAIYDAIPEPMPPAVAAGVLSSLRLAVDQQWINHFGEHVWIGPRHDAAGKRMGITDCCFVAEPCDRHQLIAAGAASQQVPHNSSGVS